MTHRDPPGAETAGTLALFPSDAAWARTRVLDAFARYCCNRILTYSSSIRMVHTVVDRFAESHVECGLSDSRAVDNVAYIISLQTEAMGVGNGRTVKVATRCRVKW